jgi:hypothetical protein
MTSPASTPGGNRADCAPPRAAAILARHNRPGTLMFRFLLLATFLLPGPVLAGPLVDSATVAEEKLAAGDYSGAMEAGRAIFDQLWQANPGLTFSQALLVAQNATGFGVFNPRENNVFKPGEPILIYCEPLGFAYGEPGAGLFSVNFIIDLQVLDALGNELANAPGATEFNMTSRHRNREVQANITYTLDGLPIGRYTLITTLRDKNSLRTGSFQTAIEVAQ